MHKLRHLHSKHQVVSVSDFLVVVETFKQKISSCAAKLRKYKTRLMRQWQNKLFRQNEKKFYAQLVKDGSEVQSPPDLVVLETFWKSLSFKINSWNT